MAAMCGRSSFTEEPDAEVKVANGIIIVSFKKPVEISVDRLDTAAASYIAAARRDPDGSAVPSRSPKKSPSTR